MLEGQHLEKLRARMVETFRHFAICHPLTHERDMAWDRYTRAREEFLRFWSRIYNYDYAPLKVELELVLDGKH